MDMPAWIPARNGGWVDILRNVKMRAKEKRRRKKKEEKEKRRINN